MDSLMTPLAILSAVFVLTAVAYSIFRDGQERKAQRREREASPIEPLEPR